MIFPIPAQKLIPQRPPFVMIDELVYFEDKVASTTFNITEENIMLQDDGTLSIGGLIENMAQTCAARIGYINTYINAQSIKIGVVGSIKNLIVNTYPLVGDTLKTTVTETFSGMLNMTLLDAVVTRGEEILATCEIKVALTDKSGES